MWPPAGAHPGRPPLGEVGGRLGGSLGGSVAGLAYILCFWPRDRDGLQRRCGMWPSWPQDTGTEQTVTSRSQSPGAASKRVCRAVWAARVVLTPPGPLCPPVGRGRRLSRSPCSPRVLVPALPLPPGQGSLVDGCAASQQCDQPRPHPHLLPPLDSRLKAGSGVPWGGVGVPLPSVG